MGNCFYFRFGPITPLPPALDQDLDEELGHFDSPEMVGEFSDISLSDSPPAQRPT